jgi:hypothetical protein
VPRPDPLQMPRFVELGEKTFRLHFDCWSVAVAEQELGVQFLPVGLTKFWQSLGSVHTTMVLLYAATRTTAPQLTYQEIGRLATGPNFAEIAATVDQAFTDFFPVLLPEGQRKLWIDAQESLREAGQPNGNDSTTPPDTTLDSQGTSSGGSPCGNSAD